MAVQATLRRVTLPAGTVTKLTNNNQSRQLLILANAGGTNPFSWGFDNTVTATTGVIVAATGAERFGGDSAASGGSSVPKNEIWGFSTTGTTVAVVEG